MQQVLGSVRRIVSQSEVAKPAAWGQIASKSYEIVSRESSAQAQSRNRTLPGEQSPKNGSRMKNGTTFLRNPHNNHITGRPVHTVNMLRGGAGDDFKPSTIVAGDGDGVGAFRQCNAQNRGSVQCVSHRVDRCPGERNRPRGDDRGCVNHPGPETVSETHVGKLLCTFLQWQIVQDKVT